MFDLSLKHAALHLVETGRNTWHFAMHARPTITALAGFFFLGLVPLQAESRAVINKLVKKGVLTQAEADELIAEETAEAAAVKAPVFTTPREASTTKLSVYGKVQVQYKAVNSDNRTGNVQTQSNTGFELRRLDIGVEGRIGDSFRACVDYRGETSNPANASDAGFQADKAWIEYDTHDYGQILVGMKKATFGYEEYTSSSNILTVERGIVNNYFSGSQANTTNLGLAERRMGLYYDTASTAKIEKDGGTKFGIAVTNDIRRRFDQASDDYSYFANALHVARLGEHTLLDIGVNTVYSDTESNRKATVAGDGFNDLHSFGLEAYARLRTGRFTLLLESYNAWVENGRTRVAGDFETTAPVGAVLMASYLVDDTFEPVFAFNYLDTDGRGVAPDQVVRNAVTFANADRAAQYYLGANWYLTKSKSLKISAGMEFSRFEGAAQGSSAPVKTDVTGGRIQVQALF